MITNYFVTIINTYALTATKSSSMIADFENVSFAEAGIVTLFSMAVVFFSLLAISYLIDLIRISFNGKEKQQTSKLQPSTVAVSAPVAQNQEDETELVAVITAAISALTGKSTQNFVVRSIKKQPEYNNAWLNARRTEYIKKN